MGRMVWAVAALLAAAPAVLLSNVVGELTAARADGLGLACNGHRVVGCLV